MTAYTIEYTEAEQRAMEYACGDVDFWLQNFAHERARAAGEEVIAMEVQRRLDAGVAIPLTREEIIMQADLTRPTPETPPQT